MVSGPRWRQFSEALRASFDKDDLERLLRTRLEVRLDDISLADSFEQVFEMVNTLELLAAAAETGVGELYAAEVGEVVGRFRNGGIAGLSRADLADLVETHLWLLPAQERMSGKGFLVKQEIEDLRGSQRQK